MTEAQINANRENAKKSTGPRTAEGKNASSRNRLLHGLRANKHILLDEDPEDFLLLLHDHWDRFQPVGPAEETLVLRIANGQWRLGRALPAEAGIYRDRFHEVFQKDEARWKHYEYQKSSAEKYSDPTPAPPATPVPGDLLARAFNVDCEGPNSLARLARYENQHRAFHRSLHPSVENLSSRAHYRQPLGSIPPSTGHGTAGGSAAGSTRRTRRNPFR
jgi:hypothetical protein